MKQLLNFFLCLLGIFISENLYAQYILNGSASKDNCNCYTLTKAVNWDNGSVWNSNKINLSQSFDFHFNVYLGCQDLNGADGIVFILQPISTSIGIAGEGMGFEGIVPSVGISLDTWQNTNRNDPYYDHISIQLNGTVTHGTDLAGPVQASVSNSNIEDCAWHVFRIVWDAATKTLTTYFDGEFRLQAQYDLVKNVFNNDPMVYWGFSAATGGANNLQKFCTALNPVFITNVANNSTCIGNPVTFTDQSESFTVIQKFYWDFGDGTTSNVQNPPTHNYSLPGAYVVKHVITGMDGCVSDTMKKTINIGAKPIADFSLFDTCTNKILGIGDKSSSDFGEAAAWTWWLDGTQSTAQGPTFSNLPLGSHQMKLAVATVYGCLSDTITKNFMVWPTPVVEIQSSNGCVNKPVDFFGKQTDNAANITKWSWQFGDGSNSLQQNASHAYSTGGTKSVHLVGTSDKGCASQDTTLRIHIDQIFVDAGKDTSVQQNIPFQLSGNWTGDVDGIPQFSWSPASDLNTFDVLNPTSTLQHDQTYLLTATTNAGCVMNDNVKINVFKFPGVLVPSAFTPNHDGLNDVLRPRYNGIKQLGYFAIYNRWGQLIFKTSDMTKGWDGILNNGSQGTQVFVWIVSAEGFDGKKYQLRGTTTLIK